MHGPEGLKTGIVYGANFAKCLAQWIPTALFTPLPHHNNSNSDNNKEMNLKGM
jgi:hypothetical protein